MGFPAWGTVSVISFIQKSKKTSSAQYTCRCVEEIFLFGKEMGKTQMELMEAIENRRSIRKYDPMPISNATIEKIIHAGMCAPSAKNRQPWRFVVVQGAAKQDMISVMQKGIQREETDASLPNSKQYLPAARHTVSIMEQAPVTIFIINPLNDMMLPQSFEEMVYSIANVQSVGACIQNMLLAATAMELGGLWNCDVFFAYCELNEWLGNQGQLIAAISIGKPLENPPARIRDAMNTKVEWK